MIKYLKYITPEQEFVKIPYLDSNFATSDFDNVFPLVNKIEPITDSSFYIPKSVNFSRHTLQKYNELYNCTKVLDISKADYIIINPTIMDLGINKKYRLMILNAEEIAAYRNIFEFESDDIDYRCHIDHDGSRTRDREWLTLKVLTDAEVQLLSNIANYKFISSNFIQQKLYDKLDSTMIDEGLYKNLCKLFSSSTAEEHDIAFNIMLNCNYNKSLAYIIILSIEYYYKIIGTPTYNSVRSNTFFDYLEVFHDRYNYKLDYTNIFNILKSKGQLTRYNVNLIMPYIKSTISDYVEKNISEDITVKTITLNDEIKSKILENEVNPKQLKLFTDEQS